MSQVGSAQRLKIIEDALKEKAAGHAQRLKDIEAALAGKIVVFETPAKDISNLTSGKRLNLHVPGAEPPAKRRKLAPAERATQITRTANLQDSKNVLSNIELADAPLQKPRNQACLHAKPCNFQPINNSKTY
jgi:hypothetical protein